MALCWYLLTQQPRLLFRILSDRFLAIAVMLLPMLVVTVMSNTPKWRKTWPTDHLLLGLFTGAESLVLSCCMLFVPRTIIFRAGLTTAAVVGWLSLYARTTKRDFTKRHAAIMQALLALTVFQLVQAFFFRHSPAMHSIYSMVGAFAFAILLVVHTQQIVGGKSAHSQIAPDEHVLASVLLYTDIVALFVHLLSIMNQEPGGRSGGGDDGGGSAFDAL